MSTTNPGGTAACCRDEVSAIAAHLACCSASHARRAALYFSRVPSLLRILYAAWNGNAGFPVDNPQAGLDIIVLCVLVGLFAAVRYEVLPAMIAGTALLGVWCYFHLATWWWPYVRGVESAGELRFHVQLENNIQLLPRWGRHIPPGGEHIAIDVLVFPATALTLIATVVRARRWLRRSHGA